MRKFQVGDKVRYDAGCGEWKGTVVEGECVRIDVVAPTYKKKPGAIYRLNPAWELDESAAAEAPLCRILLGAIAGMRFLAPWVAFGRWKNTDDGKAWLRTREGFAYREQWWEAHKALRRPEYERLGIVPPFDRPTKVEIDFTRASVQPTEPAPPLDAQNNNLTTEGLYATQTTHTAKQTGYGWTVNTMDALRAACGAKSAIGTVAGTLDPGADLTNAAKPDDSAARYAAFREAVAEFVEWRLPPGVSVATDITRMRHNKRAVGFIVIAHTEDGELAQFCSWTENSDADAQANMFKRDLVAFAARVDTAFVQQARAAAGKR